MHGRERPNTASGGRRRRGSGATGGARLGRGGGGGGGGEGGGGGDSRAEEVMEDGGSSPGRRRRRPVSAGGSRAPRRWDDDGAGRMEELVRSPNTPSRSAVSVSRLSARLADLQLSASPAKGRPSTAGSSRSSRRRGGRNGPDDGRPCATSQALGEALVVKLQLEAAQRALQELRPSDIVEIRSMQHPPPGMTIAIEAVCILLGHRPKMVAGPRPGSKVPDYWPVARSLMADGFVKKLLGFEPESITAATVARLEPYITNPKFATAKMAKISVPCAKMTDWVTSMYKFYFVNERVKPLRAEAEGAKVSLDETLARLEAARATLREVEERIDELTAEYVAADERKSVLEAEVEECKLKIARAEELNDGLGDEKVRWRERVVELSAEFGSQLGDVLLDELVLAQHLDVLLLVTHGGQASGGLLSLHGWW